MSDHNELEGLAHGHSNKLGDAEKPNPTATVIKGSKTTGYEREHHQIFAYVASCPSQQHLAQTGVSDGYLGQYHGLALINHARSAPQDQVGQCAVFTDGCMTSHKGLFDPVL